MRKKYAIGTWDLIVEYRNSTNVVTKSTILNIVKNRAIRGDKHALRAWLETVLSFKFDENMVENYILHTLLSMVQMRNKITPLEGFINNSREIAYLLRYNDKADGNTAMVVVFMLYYEIISGNDEAYDKLYTYLKWGILK